MARCRDDLTSLTRYVTWNLDERSSGALCRALPHNKETISVYPATLEGAKGELNDQDDKDLHDSKKAKLGQVTAQTPLSPVSTSNKRNVDRDYRNLLQLMEEAMMSRDANRTNLVVGGLVQHIVASWREQFCKSVTSKYNCYFMLPFIDEFHRFIRTELQKVYDGEAGSLTAVFDLTSVRRSLEVHRTELEKECTANQQLQEKFQFCAKMMQNKKESRASPFGKLSR
jgi:hypothetical protein